MSTSAEPPIRSATSAFRGPTHSAVGTLPRVRMTFVDKAQTASVLYLGVWAISPPLLVNQWARVAAVVAFGLWLLGEMTRRGGVVVRPGRAVLIAVFYLAYTAGLAALIDGVAGLTAKIQIFLFVTFFILFQAARRHGLEKYRWILWPSLALLVIWMAVTIGALRSDSHITRELVRNSEDSDQYAAAGIGGYGLVYAALWTIPGIYYLVRNLPRVRSIHQNPLGNWAALRRPLAALALVLALMLVLFGGYSIAVLSLVLAAGSYLLLRGRGHGRRVRVVIASALAILVLGLSQTSLLGNVLDGLSTVTQGTNYNMKIEDIRASLETDRSVGSVYGRTERYERSIRLFLEQPIVGTLSFRDVGKHSLVLDNFAQFGLIGGCALLYILLSVPLVLIRASSDRPILAGTAFAMMVIVAACTFLNNIGASMGYILYFFYPLAMTYQKQLPLRRPRQPPI